MVPLVALWLPVVLSAIVVFLVSGFLHTALAWHNKEYRKLPNEDEALAAIGRDAPAPGMYMLPYVMGQAEYRKPETQRRFAEGPVGILFLRQPGPITMGPLLAKWFLTALVISLLAGYVGSAALPRGTEYLRVFRVVGTAAILGYAGAHAQNAIWRSEPRRVALKDTLDGVIYGLLTAGVFGWLWPR
ncbi:MAG TPA: hypothetical protein VFQ38_15290 [Longimicrobiales bacterium]|nr:hypothetical protein [Longimicrobiales bacterium]